MADKARLIATLQHPDYQDRTAILNIAFAIDINYLKPCGICLNSIAMNNPQLAVDFYIFTTYFDEFGFNDIVQNYPHIRIYVYQLNHPYFDNLQTNYHFTTAIYYRLSIADILSGKIEQFIYLDADIICNGSLDKLASIRLTNQVIGAVEDSHISRDYINQLGLPQDHLYFNSGVMLININQWQALKVLDKFNQLITLRSYKYPDQDVLNLIVKDHILYLDSKYNDLTQGNNPDARLIHFVSSPKPWNMASLPNTLYLHYYDLSPWHSEPRDLPKTAKDAKNYAKQLKKTGHLLASLKWYWLYCLRKIIKA